jgi:hypothetical protein
VKQPKRTTEPDLLVPCLFLDSPRDHSHKYKVSRTLDTEAVFNVASAFPSRRYRLGRSLYLHPPPERTPDEERAFPLARKLSRGIRLLFGSRPGLDDNAADNPRVMKPSFTELEELFLKLWRPLFRKLARPMLMLPPEISALLPAEYANRDHIDFMQGQGSGYKWLSGGRRRVPQHRTCAFLLNKEGFYQGASLTSFFAMDGVAGLIWSQLLRDRHAAWLTQPGFRMVELIGTSIPRRMEDLSFVDSWQVVSLFHVDV